MVPTFFLLEFGLSDFKWPKMESTATRLICSLLLHMIIFGELKQALSVLRYLKFVKTQQGGRRGRAINVLLCSMQCISPLVAETVLMLSIAQEESLSMIIKSFVALGFVIKVDDMFSENFPDEIKDTASNLVLVIGKDTNTFKRIWKGIRKNQRKGIAVKWDEVIFNVLVNLWYGLLNNFYIVVYYYFMPLSCVLIQFIAFYYQQL